jgi:hypothetical protein
VQPASEAPGLVSEADIIETPSAMMRNACRRSFTGRALAAASWLSGVNDYAGSFTYPACRAEPERHPGSLADAIHGQDRADRDEEIAQELDSIAQELAEDEH